MLTLFHRAVGQFVPLDEFRRVLDSPKASVAKELAELEKLGFEIEAHPHWGFRLLQTPDRLMADDLQARFQPQTIGHQILVFEETASTNDVVEHLALKDSTEGAVVFAETQTRGRGRHGRVWTSPRGKGLWFSVLLRPRFPPPRITIAASVAVVRAVRDWCGVECRIKWPNDVIVDGKKLAGILTEVRGATAVLGLGVNVNCQPTDFPTDLQTVATSLEILTGRRHDRPALAARLLKELDRYYLQAAQNFDALSEEWAGLSTTLGKQLVLTIGTRRIEGQAFALDGNGALILRRDNGQTERIVGADVTVER